MTDIENQRHSKTFSFWCPENFKFSEFSSPSFFMWYKM